MVVEFVNPKYKDNSRRVEFKKPTRLECMMQDFPKLMDKELGASSKASLGFDSVLNVSNCQGGAHGPAYRPVATSSFSPSKPRAGTLSVGWIVIYLYLCKD